MKNRHTTATRLLVAALSAAALATGGAASAETSTTSVIEPQSGFSRYVFADTVPVTVSVTTPERHLLTDCEEPGKNCTEYKLPSQSIGDGSSIWYRLSLFAQRDPGAYLDTHSGCATDEVGVRITFTGTTTETDVVFLVEDLNIVEDPAAPTNNDVYRLERKLTPKSITDQGVSLCIDGL